MLTLGPHLDRYLTERRKRGEITALSARDQRYRMEGFVRTFGARPIQQLGPAAIDRYLQTIGHLAPATRRTYISNVRVFCDWLVDKKLIRHNPTHGLGHVKQPRSVPRALPKSDVGQLLAHLPDKRAEVIVVLMVGLGLRCCEVATVEVGDYDRQGRLLRVTGKGGHERVLPVPDEAARAINYYLGTERLHAGPLIPSYVHRGRPLTAKTISGMVRQWMRDAGIKRMAGDGISAHALRHTAASDVLDNCHDLRVVQEMLGHVQLTTTSIYLRRAGLSRIRDAMEGRDYRNAQ